MHARYLLTCSLGANGKHHLFPCSQNSLDLALVYSLSPLLFPHRCTHIPSLGPLPVASPLYLARHHILRCDRPLLLVAAKYMLAITVAVITHKYRHIL